MLLPKDYVRFRLTGELATDVSDASGTVLLDVGRRAWSPELAEAFAVDPGWLPAVHESGAVTGHTAAGVPVAAGAGDQAAGALGVGVTDDAAPPRWCWARAASSSPPATPSPPIRRDACTRSATRCPSTWHVMGVILSAAGALSWLADDARRVR